MTSLSEHDRATRRAQAPWGMVEPETVEWRPPPPLRHRLWRALSTPSLAAAAVFIAVLLASLALVWVRPHEPIDEAPLSDASETAGLGSVGPTSHSDDMPPADGGSETVLVHVVGEVKRPGVVELDAGARVAAALEAAGGPSETAALAGVNLARVLIDGEQIVVPNAEQLADAQAPGGTGGASSGLVSLNSADATALETLPKVGPALAQRIIEWREANAGFSSIDQLLDVSGIGQKTFDGLRDRVTL